MSPHNSESCAGTNQWAVGLLPNAGLKSGLDVATVVTVEIFVFIMIDADAVATAEKRFACRHI